MPKGTVTLTVLTPMVVAGSPAKTNEVMSLRVSAAALVTVTV